MTPTITTETEPLPYFRQYAGTRRFTVTEYRKMIDAAVLTTDDKVELLDGYILYKADYPELYATDTVYPEWRELRRWSVSDYQRMVQLGVIREDERLELLDGYLVLKMSQNPPHRTAVTCLSYRLPSRLSPGWLVMVHCPTSLGTMNPEPDGVIVRGTIADYSSRVPVGSDFGIVVEVSDTTLDLDRSAKGRLYACAGIPVYWIVNLADRQIEVYSAPDATANPPAYATRTDYPHADVVPITLDGQQVATIPVADLIA